MSEFQENIHDEFPLSELPPSEYPAPVEKYQTVHKQDLSKHQGEEAMELFSLKDQMDYAVQKILDTNGELPGAEYDSLFNHMEERRMDYIAGSDKKKGLVVRDINLKAQAVKEYKAFRENLAAAYDTKQLMNKWAGGAQGQAVMALLQDKARLVQKICPENMNCPDRDELGVVMPDFKLRFNAERRMEQYGKYYLDPNLTAGMKKDLNKKMEDLEAIVKSNGERWMGISDLKKMIKLKDSASKDLITTMGNNWLHQSTRVNPLDGHVFNYGAAKHSVKSTVIKKSKNLQSLAYDEMIPGRVFYEDIQKQIMGTTQWDDPQSAKLIADSLINDPRHKLKLEEELTLYYTEFLRRQWEMGEINRPKSGMGSNVNKKTKSKNDETFADNSEENLKLHRPNVGAKKGSSY